jgi:hypothetical protein
VTSTTQRTIAKCPVVTDTKLKKIVCATNAGTYKHVIFDLDPVPHHSLVLEGDPVADAGTGFNEGMITYIAVAPDHGSLHDVRESPYMRAGSNLVALAKPKAMDEYPSRRGHG